MVALLAPIGEESNIKMNSGEEKYEAWKLGFSGTNGEYLQIGEVRVRTALRARENIKCDIRKRRKQECLRNRNGNNNQFVWR